MTYFRRCVVIGAGAGGAELARTLAGAGIDTTVFDPDPHAGERITRFLRGSGAHFAGAVQNVGAVDGVLIAEDLVAPSAFGTPALIASLSQDVDGPGLGFCPVAPVHLRQLVEIRPCDGQDHAPAFALARQLGKEAVLAPATGWSLATRLTFALNDAATGLVMDGAVPHELDEAMVAFGFDLGVFEAQDLIGLDVGYALRRSHGGARPHWAIPDRMFEEGRLGKKASVGWYRYPGGGGAVIDPLVEDLAREEAWFAGHPARDIALADMLQPLIDALRDEGQKIIDQALVDSAQAIDRICVSALGYPAKRPGPMSFSPPAAASPAQK